MSSEYDENVWVMCPVCHKANPAGTRYCQHCWGAVIHPEITISSEEVEEVTRRHEAYLARRKKIKAGLIGLGSLVVLLIVYLTLYSTTDIVARPPQDVNSDSLPGEWAMFRHDLNRTGSAESSGIVPEGNLKWVFPTGAPVHSSPAVAGDTVYVGSQNYNFYALDADTGAKKWEFETGSWVESSPSVAGGRVYFGSNDSRLYSLDTQNGEKVWEFKTDFPVKAGPAITADTIFFGSDDYSLYAVDISTGTMLWGYDIGSPATSSPVVTNGIVFIGSANGYTYALNSQTGQRRLRFKSHYAIYGAPVVNDGIFYVVTSNGFLYAVDGSARTRWREHEIRPIWWQLWIMGVPLVSRPPEQTGLIWFKRLEGPATSSPVVAGDTLYLGLGNKMVAIDIQSRDKRWEFETGGTIRSSPSVVDSTVFFGSEDGRLYAVDAASGEKLWDYLTGDKITASPAVVNGVVYISSHDGKLYAIE